MPAPASVLTREPQSIGRVPVGGESLRAALADVWQLREAWWRVKRAGGSAGPDGQTLDVFAVGLDAKLEALAAAVANGRYRPGLLARRILAKKDGGVRAIGVANVCDRVLQTAAGQWLQARFEPQFLPMSFGYRPHLRPQRAALHASRLAASFAHVVNTDIERFFDTVDHGILMRLLAEQRIEQRDRDLLLAWLRATPLDRGALLATVKGLPQGLPISPPLTNLYCQ